MRVFQRFVFAFGNGKHRHFMTFAEVEARRAYQVTDVFNEQNTVVCQRQSRRGIGNHLCIKMAAFTGVHLDGGRTGGANTRGIVNRLLVAFDHRTRHAVFQLHQCFS
ncbi:hypothetical protein D3C73_1269480 [compost metagenome]